MKPKTIFKVAIAGIAIYIAIGLVFAFKIRRLLDCDYWPSSCPTYFESISSIVTNKNSGWVLALSWPIYLAIYALNLLAPRSA